MSTTYDWDRALAHLRRRDRDMKRIISVVGRDKPARLGSAQTPFATLLRSIVYQQLSGKAAGSIHRRVLDLFPGRRPSARALLALDGLRAALGGPVALEGPLGTRSRDEGGGAEDSEPAGSRRHGR